MASLTVTRRLAGRAVRSATCSHAVVRGFRHAAAKPAAHNFAMPAMSPTMTEGNIASWKVKEGDSFSAGDVLLEIETDKAQMDVEAQDDGMLAKIMQPDGSKSVKVGTRIAVMADPGDDLSALEIPSEDESQSQSTSQPTPESSEQGSESAAESPPSPKENVDVSASKGTATSESPDGPSKQRYPLYPSVQHLFHEKGLSTAEADKIPASGPNGRLLKGDVLAYLGRIEKSYAAEQSRRIEKLGHLDFSNIKKAVPSVAKTDKPAPAAVTETEAPKSRPLQKIELPISLDEVRACQRRLKRTLGAHLPLSSFITRATEWANEDLPRTKRKGKHRANELFDAILGLDKVPVPATYTGSFRPTLAAVIPPVSFLEPRMDQRQKQPDIIDMLTAKTPKVQRVKPSAGGFAGGDAFTLSVTAPTGNEHEARIFLERVKSMLEDEPGRLVLNV